MSIEWNKVNLIDAVAGMKLIDSNSVDCVIIDPPYNIGKDFGNNKMKSDLNEYTSWAKEWITEAERIIKPSGLIYIYGFSEILAYVSAEVSLPYRWLSWHYTNKTVPSLHFWQRSHESILCIWKDKKERVFHRDEVREPYTEQYIKGYSDSKRKRPAGDSRFGKKMIENEAGEKVVREPTDYVVNKRGALPKDVIKVGALAGGGKERFTYCPSLGRIMTRKHAKKLLENDKDIEMINHPTQKPIKLTNILLNSCTSTGEQRVVIPFSGTGSEALACQQKGLSWISFEINEDYVDMANLLVKHGFPTNNIKK